MFALNRDINIFVSYHKDTFVPSKSKYFFPIQVGTTLSAVKLDMLHDNTGDNISELNQIYCELTAQYWAWKNVDSEYYGFMHYRRFLSFNHINSFTNNYNITFLKYFDDESFKKMGFCDSDSLSSNIKNYDLILPIPTDLEKTNHKNVYEQYKGAEYLHTKDLDIMLETINKYSPSMYKSAIEYIYGKKMYLGNIFIMKKQLFLEYSDWLFNILNKVSERIKIDKYTVEEKRVIGHLAERMLGVFVTYKQKKSDIKISEKQLIMFEKSIVNPGAIIENKFKSDSIPIVYSTNEKYLKFTAVSIKSLICNSSDERNYDIIILHTDLSDFSKKLLLSEAKSNVSIRFLDVDYFINKFALRETDHCSKETYFRLLIPKIMPKYSKAIYLDGDTIIKCDIAELYNINLENNLVGSCNDIVGLSIYNRGRDLQRIREFECLHMKNIYNYINPGILLMNLNAFRQDLPSEKLLEIAEKRKFRWQDQDLLSVVCEGRVLFLGFEWNMSNNPYHEAEIAYAPADYYLAWKKASKNPKILHFAAGDYFKPWNRPDISPANEFWKYAKLTNFYEMCLYEMSNYCCSHNYSHNFKIESKKSFVRKVADIILPIGTKRREKVKILYYKIKW